MRSANDPRLFPPKERSTPNLAPYLSLRRHVEIKYRTQQIWTPTHPPAMATPIPPSLPFPLSRLRWR